MWGPPLVTFEAVLAVAILVAVILLLMTEAFPVELVALATMATLMLTRLVTPEEGVSGFANPAVITILALFVISAGIYRTGIITFAARRLAMFTGKSERRILVALVLVVGPVSAFLSNTATVAIFLPLVMTLAKESRVSPSRLLLPLSFASMLAGTITLIGTSTNVLASSLLAEGTGRAFGMFEFAPVGILLFLVGATYLLLASRRLLPERVPAEPEEDEGESLAYLTEARVRADSPLVEKTPQEIPMRELYHMEVVAIRRNGVVLGGSVATTPIEIGDVITLRTDLDELPRIEESAKLDIVLGPTPPELDEEGRSGHKQVIEVVVSPTSKLIRRRLSEAGLTRRFGVRVLGVRRGPPFPVRGLDSSRLNFGDAVAVLGTPQAVERLQRHADVIVAFGSPAERYSPRAALLALGIMAGVVALPALNVLPLLVAAVTGAVLIVATGVLPTDDLWKSVRWEVIFLLAGLIPLGIALENTGVASGIGWGIAALAQRLPDVGILMAFYVASSALTESMSNAATVILLVPVALATATQLGVNPEPLVLSIMFAASASFVTPLEQTSLMVYGPGGYRFFDFTRMGAPLKLILLFVTSFAIPVFFPLR